MSDLTLRLNFSNDDFSRIHEFIFRYRRYWHQDGRAQLEPRSSRGPVLDWF